VKGADAPVAILTLAGLTDTEVRMMRAMEIGTAELCLVTLSNVAFTNRLTFPPLLPAVNVTVAPVELLRLPKPLVRVQEKVTPAGHAIVQVGVAVNACWPPLVRAADTGFTDTEARVNTVMISGELWMVREFKVPFTNIPSDPEVLAAVKVTEDPV
jgi:hypothetical protein